MTGSARGAPTGPSGQLALFSADTVAPEVDDLQGLLAAHGQVSGGPAGARLSILLRERWRAVALLEECGARGVPAEIVEAPQSWRDGRDADAVVVRTDRAGAPTGVADLAGRWTRGAIKAAPEGLVVTPGMVRIWALAAGRGEPGGYLLGLDAHAPGTHAALAGALDRVGLRGKVVNVPAAEPAGRAGDGPDPGAAAEPARATVTRPALRVTGVRNRRRLAEMIGDTPSRAPDGTFPTRSQ